ncbi:MAG: hypothetical protein R3F29_07380 [Planctomycetota bacterium]
MLAAQSHYRVPDLDAIELPGLEHPEELWQFLTDPDTPFDQALAAAKRCGEAMPIGIARQVLLARRELLREEAEHRFWLTPPPTWSTPLQLRSLDPGEHTRERTLLGRSWTPPAATTQYPTTWAEAAVAPWPWRVSQAVQATWKTIIAAIGRPTASLDNDDWWRRTEAWYAGCATWPIDTDSDALLYVEATSFPLHGKTTAVLARWRRILLDPRTPQAALLVAGSIGTAHRSFVRGDDDARQAHEVLLIDGLQHGPDLSLRWACSQQLRHFAVCLGDDMRERRVACPPEALLVTGNRAVAPGPDDIATASWPERDQLTDYAYPVCEAVTDAPIAVERSGFGDDRELAARQLAAFAKWWEKRRPEIEALTKPRAAALQALRERLDKLAR